MNLLPSNALLRGLQNMAVANFTSLLESFSVTVTAVLLRIL